MRSRYCCGRKHIAAPKWALPTRLMRYLLRRVQQFNPRSRSRSNVAHHYDLDGRLYSLFLDADQQYSCAYFESEDQSLDDAQLAKKRHLAAKLLVDPGANVLDIGCGWGGLALYLAEVAGAHATGITLSREQYARAQQRAVERGRSDDAIFRLIDYRDVTGGFDRIVSVGMFEHVGVGFYDRYFRKCAQLLDDDGVFLLHTIGRSSPPSVTNPWIAKYIFPGGYIPALSEVLPGCPARETHRHRRRDSPASLRRDAQGLARTFPRAPRGSRAGLRSALRADVGILSGFLRNGLS